MSARKGIMVVDDSPIMRIVIGNIINEDPQLQILEYAENGKDALDKLNQVKPDLIMLDLEMPQMDGVEFLRNAKMKTNAKVIVVTVSGADSPKLAQARLLGVDAVVQKPSGAVSADLKDKKGLEIKQKIRQVLNI